MRTPAGGFALNLHELLLFGRLQDAADDRESHTGRKLKQMVHKYRPTVGDTKLAYDRLINATLEHHLGPDYPLPSLARPSRRRRRRRRSTGGGRARASQG